MSGTWLSQKSIVIIGGTTGIGLSAAQAFVGHGAKVVVVGRNEESVEKATVLLKEDGAGIAGDASMPGTASRAIDLCKKKFGSFHGLYHVAGGSGRKFGDGPLHELTLEGWNQTFQLNLTSLMLSNQEAIKAFMEQKTPGSILNMGSVLGFSPSPKHFVTHAYAATKSAVIGFTKSIASYYATHDIRINVLAPALVETPMAQRAAKDDRHPGLYQNKTTSGWWTYWPATRSGWCRRIFYVRLFPFHYRPGARGGWRLVNQRRSILSIMKSLAIGIDLGSTNIKGVLIDCEGNVLHDARNETNEQNDSHWKQAVAEMVKDFEKKAGRKIEIIGLSAPGLADSTNQCISFMPGRLPGLENYQWSQLLKERVWVLNDAHSALMAEAAFGVAKGLRHVVLLSLGTGVGGGILINGELYQGVAQMAGHIGHISINADSTVRDITNMPGSIEDAIGNATLGVRSNGKYHTTEELVNDFRNEDPFASQVWLTSVRRLAVCIASMVNVLSPECIILSGGITQANDALLNPLKTFLETYEWRPGGKQTPVKFARFSDRAGAIGAAGFALSKMK